MDMLNAYEFANASQALPILLRDIRQRGDELGSRNGRVKELQNVHITLLDPMNREIITPGRNASLPAQIAETAWVLAGRDDIEWLSHYLPRAPQFSDDGKTWRGAYGPRIRQWSVGLDQLQFVVEELKLNPQSRRAVIQIYSPNVDSDDGKDIPCNNWLHFLSRKGELHLHVAVRSNDVFWGWSGINAFEWSVLLEIVAGMLGLRVGTLHFSISSLHLYDRHWKRAETITLAAGTETFVPNSPRFGQGHTVRGLDQLLERFFVVEQGIRETSLDVDEAIDNFPEPMFRSWLRVLLAHWEDSLVPLNSLEGTGLHEAYRLSPRPKDEPTSTAQTPEPVIYRAGPLVEVSPFLQYVIPLHDEKHLAYGDSWCRRGEMLGILANIARKVDRLYGGETSDETKADTGIDLMVYLAKYLIWLDRDGMNDPDLANEIMVHTEKAGRAYGPVQWTKEDTIERFTHWLDVLEGMVASGVNKATRMEHVSLMLDEAYRLARYLWEQQNIDEYKGADHE